MSDGSRAGNGERFTSTSALHASHSPFHPLSLHVYLSRSRRTFSRSAESRGPVHNLVYGILYRTLEVLSFTDSEAWHIPLSSMVELGMAIEI